MKNAHLVVLACAALLHAPGPAWAAADPKPKHIKPAGSAGRVGKEVSPAVRRQPVVLRPAAGTAVPQAPRALAPAPKVPLAPKIRKITIRHLGADGRFVSEDVWV